MERLASYLPWDRASPSSWDDPPQKVRVVTLAIAIAGAEDHAYTVELSEQIARLSADGRCIVINAAGHSTCLEAPEPVNRALAAHFERASAGAA